MARDATLLAARNTQILADYNRLSAEEHAFKVMGRTCYVRLKREQVIAILSKLYHLSPRTLEALVYEAAPKPAPIAPSSLVRAA